AFLNYRHSADPEVLRNAAHSLHYLGSEERTNYPLALAVDDWGAGFGLTAQVSAEVDPERICRMMQVALEGLVGALETHPERPVRELEVLPPGELEQLLVRWNETAAAYPQERCIHELFEEQVRKAPGEIALVYEQQQ